MKIIRKKKQILYFGICIILFLSVPIKAKNKKYAKAACIGIGCLGIYALYKWITTPEKFVPTLENLNTLTLKQLEISDCPHIPSMEIDQLVRTIHEKKIPTKSVIIDKKQQTAKKFLATKGVSFDKNNQTIFLFSRGYAQTNKLGTNDNFIQSGACATGAYWYLKDNFIEEAPCVTFDYPDHRRCFNFGQDTDIACLKFVYEHIQKCNPHARIILLGDCRGAKSALAFASTQPKNLHALALFSPFLSARQLTDQIAINRLSWMPKSSIILHNFFQWYFPNYNGNEKSVLTMIENIEKHVPIFIAHRHYDHLVADEHISALVDELKATGHGNVHVAYTNDTTFTHSRLNGVVEIQQQAKIFFKQYAFETA